MKRLGPPRSVLAAEIFRLQQLALHALPPEWDGQKALPGKPTQEDEKALRLTAEYLPDAREEIEYLGDKLKKQGDRDLLFMVVAAVAACARFVGSRAQVSDRQQSVFAVKRAKTAGIQSGRSRAAEARDRWRAEVVRIAQGLREQDPRITNEAIADKAIETWRLRIPVPARRSILDFIPRAERDGLLPRKKRQQRPHAKSRLN